MAATSVQDIRDYVRLFIDVDSSDIPDSLADAWIRDGFNRMIRSDRQWPFYMVGGTGSQYILNTVSQQQSYTLPNVTIQGVNATVPVRNIVAVQGQHWELKYSDQGALESTFPAAFAQAAEPERYSVWGDSITFWPTPNGTYPLNIRAYREPIDWVSLGAGGQVDAPDDFAPVLQSYVLSMAWLQQTDIEQAASWEQRFEKGVQELKNNYIRALLPQGLVLNGGRVTRELEPRLRFPFEGLGTGD